MKQNKPFCPHIRTRLDIYARAGTQIEVCRCANCGWMMKQSVDPAVAKLHLWTRLWRNVEKGAGCWNWTGDKDNHGYGRLQIGNRSRNAHRLVYELIHGETDLYILHGCDNPACVRPDHLHAGTQGDNMREAAARGRLGRKRQKSTDKVWLVTDSDSDTFTKLEELPR